MLPLHCVETNHESVVYFFGQHFLALPLIARNELLQALEGISNLIEVGLEEKFWLFLEVYSQFLVA